MPTGNNPQRTTCYDCGEVFRDTLTVEQRTNGEGIYRCDFHPDLCESCEEQRHYFLCDGCGSSYHMDERNSTEGGRDLCDSCDRDEEDADTTASTYRDYSSKNLGEFQGKLSGDIITSPRIFAAEIECYYPSNSALKYAADELSRHVGITEDGSLNDNGVELQTPKLKGNKGEQAIRDICAVLNKQNFTVDESAGLHIHLDGKGLFPRTRTRSDATAIRDMFLFYIVYEDVLLSFLPEERRTNTYCLGMRSAYSVQAIVNARTVAELEKIWYGNNNRNNIARRKKHIKDGSRYRGINFHSLFAQKHLEIRFHSGTTNAVKILEWTNLHQTILDRAVAGTLFKHWNREKEAANVIAVVDLSKKTQNFFDALQLPERARKYFTRRQKRFNKGDILETDMAVTIPNPSNITRIPSSY